MGIFFSCSCCTMCSSSDGSRTSSAWPFRSNLDTEKNTGQSEQPSSCPFTLSERQHCHNILESSHPAHFCLHTSTHTSTQTHPAHFCSHTSTHTSTQIYPCMHIPSQKHTFTQMHTHTHMYAHSNTRHTVLWRVVALTEQCAPRGECMWLRPWGSQVVPPNSHLENLHTPTKTHVITHKQMNCNTCTKLLIAFI